jgi:predicted dehydrogenase
MSSPMSRREFLGTSTLAAAAAMSAVSARTARAAGGANERLRVALVGCGSRGRADAHAILKVGGADVELVALCDVDKRQSAATAKAYGEQFDSRPEMCQDFRRVIDRKDIDIVVIGTPDHWHAAVMMLACASGKDVYVEKPISHNIREGRAMVATARKYKRIVQVGMQQRSDPHFREATEYLRKGSPLGVISRTATFNFNNETPNGIGNPPDTDPPADVNYDMWLGAAPRRPFNPNRFHWSWRFFYDYGGGMICDWNVHIQDIVHWGMRVDAPLSIAAFGPTLAHGPLQQKGEGYKRVLKDNRETPDMMDVVYEYQTPDGHLFTQVYTMGKVYHRGDLRESYGTEFYGSNGSLFINRGGWRVTPEATKVDLDDPEHRTRRVTKTPPRTPAIKKPGDDTLEPHVKNFLDCVRSRKAEDLHCDIEIGHRTASACHLGNVALRVGRKLWWDGDREIALTQDGKPDEQANKLLTREYRPGFELPKV